MGENLTDSGQKSNGSGKSALQNAVELAYKGDFSRKINKAKIVRRGERELEIECCSFNNVKNEYMLIHRIIPVKGSEKVNVYIYKDQDLFEKDKEKFKIDIATTNDANNWIIDYIGISKEDLSNYFFPNELTYKSFFDASDTQNKALIGRFSNADIADKAFINIQKELDELGVEFINKEKEILKIETTLENRQDDLVKENNRNLEEEKQEQIDELNSDIETLKNDINKLLSLINDNTKVKKIIARKRLKTVETLDKKQEKLRYKLNSSKDFKKQYEELETKEVKIKKNVSDSNGLLDDIETDISSVKKDIQSTELKMSGKIKCPKCSHEFVLGSEFTLEQLSTKLIEFREELESFEKEQDNTNLLLGKYKKEKDSLTLISNSLQNEEKEFKREVKKLEDQQEAIEDFLSALDSQLKTIKKNDEDTNLEIESKQKSIQLKESSIEEIKNTDFSKFSKKKELTKQIKDLKFEIKEKEVELSEIVAKQEKVKEWELYFKSFKSFLANKKLKIIEGMMNKFLTDMGVDFQIKLEGYTTVNNGKDIREKITPYIFKDGQLYGYHEFSKGERARMNMSNLFTLQTIINETSKIGGLDLAFLDEIAEGVDEEGLSTLLHSLGTTKKTTLLTTHVVNEKIHENILMIQKINGISRIVNN